MPRPPHPALSHRAQKNIKVDIETPPELKAVLWKRFNIDHDPCPLGGKERGPDGLDRNVPWGKRNFVNPPYTSRGIKDFVDRAIEERAKGNESYILVPFRASARYFRSAMRHANDVWMFKRNIKFVGYKQGFPQLVALLGFVPRQPLAFEETTWRNGEDKVTVWALGG